MRLALFLMVFLVTCMIADTIYHLLRTRLERRIGLSGSIFRAFIMNTPSYLRQSLYLILISVSTYFWTNNPLVTAGLIALFKISKGNGKYGQVVVDLASLASIVASVFFLKITGSMEKDIIITVMTVISFIIYIISVYIFTKTEDSISTSTTMRTIALNITGTSAYFGINNIYILMALSLILFSSQITVSWILPKVNRQTKMKTGIKSVIIPSLSMILLALIWSFINRGI